MDQRIGPPRAMLNPADARKNEIETGDSIAITVGDITLATMQAVVAETVPEGVILLPRRLSNTPGPFFPTTGSVEKVPETEALATI
jgi:anaerobic selenocysteine-containing dehydrogenase